MQRNSPPRRTRRTRRTQRKIYPSVSSVSSVVASFFACIVVFFAATVFAHEIPNDVTVQALLKPDGDRLRLLIRVPLIAMRDMDYPTPVRGSGLVDLAKADSTLRDAATLW